MTLVVRASVVDARIDAPKPEDVFVVDSNPWLYVLYPPSSGVPQASSYASYIQKARTNGSTLSTYGLSFAEIAHVVERCERIAYNASNALTLETKEYRHDRPLERTKVCKLIRDVWQDIEAQSTVRELIVDSALVTRCLSLIQSSEVDGYDTKIADDLIQGGLTGIITDDKDYLTVPGITVFTANANAVKSAKSAGKLIVR